MHCRGHNGSITDVCFSRNNNLLLSASKDGTARIWRNVNPGVSPDFQSAIIFSHVKHSCSQVQTLKLGTTNRQRPDISSKSNLPFGEEINFSKFFFMDKFVALVSLKLIKFLSSIFHF